MPGPLLARKMRLQAQVPPDTVPRPTVTGCTSALVGGTVTITGRDFWYPNSNLHQYHAYAVRFGNQETGANGTSVAVANATTLTCTVPAGLSGTMSVRVWGPGGSNVGAGLFVYPNAVGASPNPANGGQTVTVTGTGLGAATAWSIGPAGGNVTGVTGTQVQFTLPNGIVDGNYTLNVAVPGGNVSVGSASSFLVSNTPHPSAVTPNTGYTAGGTAITITGENLQGVTSGTLGGVALTSLVVVDSQHITAVTGGHAAGAVDLLLTNPIGSTTLASAYTYVQWTPAVSDPTGWYEDYPAGSWASLASAGTSGAAAPLVNEGASYPANGTALNGHRTMKCDSSWLSALGIATQFFVNPDCAVVMLAKTPHELQQAGSIGAFLACDNSGRWRLITGGTAAGGTAGVKAGMQYNDAGGNVDAQVSAIAAAAADAYHLLVLTFTVSGPSVGNATANVYDLGVSQSLTMPIGDHYNAFAHRPLGDVPLAGSTDPPTKLLIGGGYSGGNAPPYDAASGKGAEIGMILTYAHTLDSTTLSYLLDYARRKFGVP